MIGSTDILIAANRNYKVGLALTIKSLLQNYTRDSVLKFYLATSDMDESDRIQLEGYLSAGCCKEFSLHILERKEYAHIDQKLPRSTRFSSEANARLAIFDIFKNSAKVFYLDADLFFYNFDFGNFLDIDLGGFSLAACQGSGNYKFKDLKTDRPDLPVPEEMYNLPYLNSGVLVLDIKNGITNGAEKKLKDYLNSETAKWCDSDQFVINMVYTGDWKKVDERFNFRRFIKNGEVNYIAKKASVFHFVGPVKPWEIMPCNDFDVVHTVHRFLKETNLKKYLNSDIDYSETGRTTFLRKIKSMLTKR